METLKGKLIELIVKDYLTNKMFDFYNEKIAENIQTKLNSMLKFKTNISEIDRIKGNTILIGKVNFVDDDNLERVVDFSLSINALQ